MKIRLAGIVTDSFVDGPGVRATVFAQGCPHQCSGCHNPHTHDPLGGVEMEVEEVLAEIDRARHIQGVTFSGGEPFEQATAFAELARRIKATGRHLVLYSGYTFETLLERSRNDGDVFELLSLADWLVDGPYVESLRELSLPFRGSRNQRILLSKESMAAGRALQAMA
ncbi:anaerobic ribonucleoside-triphosphate reductase activating protein [Heliobacterium gestii]|uniref:Anaerobic ribonucleoside-triphosphate reductase-activating protein n=1 Tax=Heliomicrobium gestii TaxID=2699 RepID=A0A845LAV9_HELGE|nr:anaerobic ribonucleoside-triphosphate reductase activating protein [Heliomicrobium gestii]MBM7867545.1 anaerobic ribonucleoside-triphosphate reductase activating protein [Heliomicrobium gestii]MZP43907.1 anaerobic ribonucleoside-triphosphate reductase activating protein [Heliomicrobium gestii]